MRENPYQSPEEPIGATSARSRRRLWRGLCLIGVVLFAIGFAAIYVLYEATHAWGYSGDSLFVAAIDAVTMIGVFGGGFLAVAAGLAWALSAASRSPGK